MNEVSEGGTIVAIELHFGMMRSWSDFMKQAIQGNKSNAVSWVQVLNASGWSCPEDALIRSLNVVPSVPFWIPGLATPRTIFLVTDGRPWCNGIDTSQSVLSKVTAANFDSEIHVICVGNQPEAIEFCQLLAAYNRGRFIYASPLPPQPPPPPPPPPPPFRRGDADGDGSLSGLVDGTFLLNYQFVPGSPVPPCYDAADADDDGIVSGLRDAIRLLGFQFYLGHPAPPDPGPFQCGDDPTSDGLGCEIPPEC